MGTERDTGFPKFEHGQWTFEGEIERLGAFASGASRTTGWKRWLAVGIVLMVAIVPLVFGIVALIDLL